MGGYFMATVFPEIRVGQGIRHEALSVFPLLTDTDSSLEYLLSDEALGNDLIAVTEVSEAGSVPDLLVENKGDTRVLFLEGEELVGAKQNRMLNTTILVAARSKTRIPVSCVEQGRCVMKGARVLKIHPPTQGVDLLEKRYVPFFRRCAELNVVVMVHTGHEHSAPIISAALANPRKLALALEEGCTVVACHCGTGWATDPSDMLPDFLAMVRKYKNLWGDTSVLGSAGRVRDMSRLLADDEAKDRLLHGSDFPFPATPLAFAGTLGVRKAARLQAIDNLIERDFALKDALGIGRASAERAYRLICEEDSRS